MKPSPVTFIKHDLPPPRFYNGRHSDKWEALTEKPGQWAEWWGNAGALYTAAKHAALAEHRTGFAFEARVVAGKGYIRAVLAAKESK